jgi:hypothetical protein
MSLGNWISSSSHRQGIADWVKHKLKCVKHKLKQWQSAYSKSCNPQCGPAQRYGLVGGRRLKSGLFNRYVIVGISDLFGNNHADLQSVTPALAHDTSVKYSTAQHPNRRRFKFDKNLRKGCDRFEKKTFGLPTLSAGLSLTSHFRLLQSNFWGRVGTPTPKSARQMAWMRTDVSSCPACNAERRCVRSAYRRSY